MRLPRYLAILGRRDPFGMKRALREHLGRAGLSPALTAPGIEVFCEGPAPLVLGDNEGIVLGPIYRRDHALGRLSAVDAEESRSIVASRGQHLIEACWGDYLAILGEPAAAPEAAIVVRPPFSDLGCLRTELRGLHIIASDLALLGLCGLDTRRPAWDLVASHLHTAGLRKSATCVVGVDELLWGSRLVITHRGTRTEPCWSPWRFAQEPRESTPRELAEDLRRRIMACVAAQVGGFDHVAVMLSGGLDSSILASAVAESGVRLTCLNLPFGDSAGDERIYARAVAARLGVPLREVAPEIADVDVLRSASTSSARPIGRAFLQATQAAKQRIAAVTGASAVLDGGGGDNLFCSLQSPAPVADRLRREGLGPGLMRSASDVARMTEAGVLGVVWRAFRRAWLRGPAYRWRTDVRFLTAEALERAGAPAHRWLDAPADALPGSAAHIALMIVVENLLETSNGAVPEFAPLMAQPLVEFCLSIPSWHWFEDGHNRVVARRAFAGHLPAEIAWRRGKGSPDGFVAHLFETNRDKLGDMLVDGLLAEEGLVDRETVSMALAPSRPVKGHDYIRLLKLADVEAWVRALRGAPTPLPPLNPPAV
jgi:asparagine synthase (glutamine-hydrolysing)